VHRNLTPPKKDFFEFLKKIIQIDRDFLNLNFKDFAIFAQKEREAGLGDRLVFSLGLSK